MILKRKIVNRLAATDNFTNSHLSILICLDGFSFSLFDKDLIDVVLLKKYEFDNRAQTPKELLTQIKEVFKREPVLTEKYDSVSVSHKNNLSTIVPEALYNKDNHTDFLKYSVRILKGDKTLVDNLPEIDAKNIFIPFVKINEYLRTKIGNFNYSHASSVLVSSILQKYKHNLQKQFFVNVSKTSLDIIYLKGGKLQLYNNFFYYSKEDFLYYILFAMEQLLLNPDRQEILFLGEIDENSPLYKITYVYIRNLKLLKASNYTISDDFYNMNPNIQKHNFFELLNQF